MLKISIYTSSIEISVIYLFVVLILTEIEALLYFVAKLGVKVSARLIMFFGLFFGWFQQSLSNFGWFRSKSGWFLVFFILFRLVSTHFGLFYVLICTCM